MAKKLPEVLTDEEINRILEQFNSRYDGPRRNSLMIRLALETGLRIAELTALRFEDCRLMGNAYKIHVHDGKGGKDRIVWMPAALGVELAGMADKEGREAVGRIFQTRDGKPVQHQYLRNMIKVYGRKAGVPRLHFHLLRHTALTRLYDRTKDIRLVQDAAGHASPNTTAIYAHISGADLRDAMIQAGQYAPDKTT